MQCENTGCTKIRGITQCQLRLGNYEKNYLKNLCPLDLKLWGHKRCSFDLDYFKYLLKKTICLLLASGIIILNDCNQVCNYFLHYFQHFQV
jgi:hypothetical protein